MQQQISSKMANRGLGSLLDIAAPVAVTAVKISEFYSNPLDTSMNTNQAIYSNIKNVGPSVPSFDVNGNVIPGSTNVDISGASAPMFADDPGGNITSGLVSGYDSVSNLITKGPLNSIDGGVNWQGIFIVSGLVVAGFVGIKLLLK